MDEDRPREAGIEDTWQRVARAAAQVEENDRGPWEGRFREILENFRFIPGGRILAGAGTGKQVTLSNCFVMGLIEDDMGAIFESLKEAALTMQAGGGIGYDFSTLRPRGMGARASGNIASGPVSFMNVWNAMCDTLLSTGSRRGAMIATLRCDHPDVEDFIDAKRSRNSLDHFNLSVLVSDQFMEAVERGADWPLVFPVGSVDTSPVTLSRPADGSDKSSHEEKSSHETVVRDWPGHNAPVRCRVLDRRPARELWRKLMRAAYDSGEPGVLFVDRINAWNNLGYREQLSCTNPCGEVPLPPYGACNLGSLNLTRFVSSPFTRQARLDLDAVSRTAQTAVRFLDNIIDCSLFPLARQTAEARGSRRIGLGITGLGDALVMLGLQYGSPEARQMAEEIMGTLCHGAYHASTELAASKGPFPWFDHDAYLHRPFIRSLPENVRQLIARRGIRNSHLLAIAPAGTISLLADNVSSGVEPVFAAHVTRRILGPRHDSRVFHLEDYACRLWHSRPGNSRTLPPAFVTAWDLDPDEHLMMQESLQKYVDNSISKTINVPADYPFDQFEDLYRNAHGRGLKGCTTFRPNPYREQVLTQQGDSPCKPMSC